ncbi:hypothetical protein RHMOL_Rhmol03G0068500 [Rhododendron molle]|uniref:Uncharacterized protein n=1 Tax=Rhododendron molle TaxID=49168 RepID=A0ACC0PB46_RHOML|nr:hypothetical protein RHMOL_Rhmol03G0068500 [Rhododendron molle]
MLALDGGLQGLIVAEDIAVTVATRYGYDEPLKTAVQCQHKMEKLRKDRSIDEKPANNDENPKDEKTSNKEKPLNNAENPKDEKTSNKEKLSNNDKNPKDEKTSNNNPPKARWTEFWLNVWSRVMGDVLKAMISIDLLYNLPV